MLTEAAFELRFGEIDSIWPTPLFSTSK